MLVAQATVEGVLLLIADALVAQYPDPIRRSIIASAEPVDGRRFVSRQPCVMRGRPPADLHHLRFAPQPRALGQKDSDEHTVPNRARIIASCIAMARRRRPVPIALAQWRRTTRPGAGIEGR